MHDAQLPPGPALTIWGWVGTEDPTFLPSEIAAGEVTIGDADRIAADLLREPGWFRTLLGALSADVFLLTSSPPSATA